MAIANSGRGDCLRLAPDQTGIGCFEVPKRMPHNAGFWLWEIIMTRSVRMTLSVSAALFFSAAMLAATMFAHAQPYGDRWGWNMGAGRVMGPGMMGRAGFDRVCNAGMIGFAEWRIGRLEQTLKLTDEQRSKFEELKAASLKASEAMRTACPAEIPSTMTGQMQAIDKRLEATSGAVKTVRPALEAFYTSLNEEQKAKLDSGEGRGRFWRWHG